MTIIHGNPHPAVLDPNKLFEEGRALRTGHIANKIGNGLGSMRTFWILTCLQIVWMTLASFDVGPWRHDKYPFSFLLFLSNIFQLLALPILGYISNQSEKRRDAKQQADHKALTHIAHKVDQTHALHQKLADHLGIDHDHDMPEEDRLLAEERIHAAGARIGDALQALDGNPHRVIV